MSVLRISGAALVHTRQLWIMVFSAPWSQRDLFCSFEPTIRVSYLPSLTRNRPGACSWSHGLIPLWECRAHLSSVMRSGWDWSHICLVTCSNTVLVKLPGPGGQGRWGGGGGECTGVWRRNRDRPTKTLPALIPKEQLLNKTTSSCSHTDNKAQERMSSGSYTRLPLRITWNLELLIPWQHSGLRCITVWHHSFRVRWGLQCAVKAGNQNWKQVRDEDCIVYTVATGPGQLWHSQAELRCALIKCTLNYEDLVKEKRMQKNLDNCYWLYVVMIMFGAYWVK